MGWRHVPQKYNCWEPRPWCGRAVNGNEARQMGHAQVTGLCPGCDGLAQGARVLRQQLPVWSSLLSALQPLEGASPDVCWSLHIGHLLQNLMTDGWWAACLVCMKAPGFGPQHCALGV